MSDDDRSTVSAVLTSSSGGILDATVSTPTETYYVEPASRYFATSQNVSFPAVIYKASDVLHPDDPHGDCASHQLYLKQYEHFRAGNRTTSCHRHEEEEEAVIRPNQLIDQTLYSGWNRRHHDRKKKRRSTVDHRKTTCMLYLQADHLFYGKMGSEEACIETMTRHVQRVNSIYKNVGASSSSSILCEELFLNISDIFRFRWRRARRWDYFYDQTDQGSYGAGTQRSQLSISRQLRSREILGTLLRCVSSPPFVLSELNWFEYIFRHTEEDYNAFCLAYMFTYRDFEGGTLGLAWTGDLKNAGGVCEKNGVISLYCHVTG